ncbi:MAG: hypothetical protein OXD37_05145 [Acidimicrobiaceae bacterium]|nr:hypothetical protein [Acidimicrobiaceae bacterium]MCY4293717.1 hypothetical protein [Acidimicrobiaceae bacterium]
MQARALKRGEKVRLVSDLPGMPQGTAGKVALANGFAWNRYWLRLGDGRVVGHVDHACLIRAKDYESYLHARDREQRQAELAAQRAEDPAEAAGTQESGGNAGDASGAPTDIVVDGVTVPAYLLKRSADARTRLGA